MEEIMNNVYESIMSNRVKIAANLFKNCKGMNLICYYSDPYNDENKNVILWYSYKFFSGNRYKSIVLKKDVYVGC